MVPRGTIYEDLPVFREGDSDAVPRQSWDRTMDMIVPVEGRRAIHGGSDLSKRCISTKSIMLV